MTRDECLKKAEELLLAATDAGPRAKPEIRTLHNNLAQSWMMLADRLGPSIHGVVIDTATADLIPLPPAYPVTAVRNAPEAIDEARKADDFVRDAMYEVADMTEPTSGVVIPLFREADDDN